MKIVQPNRVTRTYTQHLVAPMEVVFPLLCPVREADWIPGWDPSLVVSSSGFAESDCVFVIAAPGGDAIWTITRHEPHAGFVEMLKVTPEVTVCKLTIQLHPTAGGCKADVTYMHTSLGPRGDELVASFTEDHYRGFMQEWEAQVNHYVRHGVALPPRTGG